MDDYQENTIGARNFAFDSSKGSRQIESNWWQYFSDYRLHQWREEIIDLCGSNSITLIDICKYLGVTYSKGIGFYDKLPKKRSMYIGIGMALKQPQETINNWITRYGMKKRLYAKDLYEDLPWLYLINANYRDRKTAHNYYNDFEKCQQTVHKAYMDRWKDGDVSDQLTVLVETDLQAIRYDAEYEGLKEFISTNMDSFRSAYVKPRKMLDDYVQRIIAAGKRADKDGASGSFVSLNSLRGLLDDSMINYLSGSTETVNVIDLKSGRRTLRFKHVPKSKKSHISLALALGMIRSEIDRYLAMMGFASLDAVDMEEGVLLNSLAIWEDMHPVQKQMAVLCSKQKADLRREQVADTSNRNKCILSEEEQDAAVLEGLHLRQDLQEMYREMDRVFPYMK